MLLLGLDRRIMAIGCIEVEIELEIARPVAGQRGERDRPEVPVEGCASSAKIDVGEGRRIGRFLPWVAGKGKALVAGSRDDHVKALTPRVMLARKVAAKRESRIGSESRSHRRPARPIML